MTTNQTIDGVSRELRALLERIAVEPRDVDAQVSRQAAVDELRALLDAPAALGEVDLTPKRLAHAENVIEQQNSLIASLRAEQPAPVAVVPELTSELRWILGQMCFQHIHTAQALRLMGHEIAKKAEDEQAVTIYWMLGHYLRDPANWRQNATAEMKAAVPAA